MIIMMGEWQKKAATWIETYFFNKLSNYAAINHETTTITTNNSTFTPKKYIAHTYTYIQPHVSDFISRNETAGRTR